MPANTAENIRAKIAQLAEAPEELANNVNKLVGQEAYRLRVGDWRVIFTEDGAILAVLAIRPRGSAYG